MISRPEADHIAGLLRTIRPHWDHLAIMAVLTNIDGDLADITWSAIRTAQNPDMRTPQALTFEGNQHARPVKAETDEKETWGIAARAQAIARCQFCDSHGRQSNGFLCPHEDPEQRAARVHAYAEQARNALAATRARAQALAAETTDGAA
jgi:hypothetical protein